MPESSPEFSPDYERQQHHKRLRELRPAPKPCPRPAKQEKLKLLTVTRIEVIQMADMPRYHYEVWADFDDGDCALLQQACLRPRDRFWGVPAPKIDSAFDNLLVPQPSWSPSTTQQLRKLVAAPYLSPNDWTPRLDAYFASPLALCARRVSSAASRLLGSTSLRFALHGWQRMTMYMV